MQRTVEQTGVFFQMGFMRRFDKGYLDAKRKIEEGVIGKPVVLNHRPAIRIVLVSNISTRRIVADCL